MRSDHFILPGAFFCAPKRYGVTAARAPAHKTKSQTRPTNSANPMLRCQSSLGSMQNSFDLRPPKTAAPFALCENFPVFENIGRPTATKNLAP
jgi:hypothetical protein